jgi:hypothetical protein
LSLHGSKWITNRESNITSKTNKKQRTQNQMKFERKLIEMAYCINGDPHSVVDSFKIKRKYIKEKSNVLQFHTTI